MMKNTPNSRGFTLLELTIVMGVFIVIGTIIVSILGATFRGNTKTRVTNDISQNGNYALSIMTNLLLNSQRFESIIPSFSTCTANPNPTCCTPAGTIGKTITFQGLDGGTTTLTCEDTGSDPTLYKISSNSASLIDPEIVRLTPDDTCYFVCTQVDEYSPPRIDIVFTLQNAEVEAGDSQASANFRTSVSLRNQNLN
ncbi:MAG: type II secretion system protein [Candidatus Levybacteria bacterium]|nr:type II secretion system protein [Candidatus Levybacteria bacterium]